MPTPLDLSYHLCIIKTEEINQHFGAKNKFPGFSRSRKNERNSFFSADVDKQPRSERKHLLFGPLLVTDRTKLIIDFLCRKNFQPKK